jgi:hypothetical protein
MRKLLLVAISLTFPVQAAVSPILSTYDSATRSLTIPAITIDNRPDQLISVIMVCDETGLNCKVTNFDRICNGFSPEREVCGSLK